MYCDEYQSILSDVDKHQRTCDSNQNKHETLDITENFDENKFLKRFAEHDDPPIPVSNKSITKVEEFKNVEDSVSKSKPKVSTQTVVEKVKRLDLNKFDTENDFEQEEPSNQQNSEFSVGSSSSSEESEHQPRKPKERVREGLMVLPHLHKHDLIKKKVYDKPSTWICGGYFSRLGCLNSFNCLFKHIDFEFPHYQCMQCEFQICMD